MRFLLFTFVFAIVLIESYMNFEYVFDKRINSVLISENFKDYKILDHDKYIYKKVKQFSIKFEINKDTLVDNTYYMSIVSDIDALTYSSVPYKQQQDIIIVKLHKDMNKDIYFNYKYDSYKRGEFRINIINEFEHDYILPFEGILYGIAYGIIFCAFLYYLLIYFSTLKKYFLYYSFMQLFVLLSLIGFVYFSFKPYPVVFGQALVDIFETLGYLFTILFVKEVLNTKKNMLFINRILNILIVLNILDLAAITIFKYSVLYEYLPFYLTFFIAACAGYLATTKGNKYARFYTIGWLMMAVLVYISERSFSPVSEIYLIHVAAPLESLIFSFALAYMLKDLVRKQNEKEKLLIHKSKLASMGEMIDNIAHQWRQPLTHLGYINMNLEISSLQNEFEKEYFIKKIKESNTQIKFMSKTIDDFRDFYKVDKTKEVFLISNACLLAVNIINPTLTKKNIILNFDIKNDSKIKGYENEFSQVILNFLTNSIDMFAVKKIKNPTVNISIDCIQNKTITEVSDNAKGIKEIYLKEVFKPYFTTKKRGSGIGLYMSQVIIQSHFEGNISVKNTEKGACFTIII